MGLVSMTCIGEYDVKLMLQTSLCLGYPGFDIFSEILVFSVSICLNLEFLDSLSVSLFKTLGRYKSCKHVMKTSCRHLGRQKDFTLKTSSRGLADIFNTSSTCFTKTNVCQEAGAILLMPLSHYSELLFSA